MAPIPFVRSDNVPILGQAFTFRAWFPTALLNCGCDSKHALLLTGIGGVAECPSCHKAFMIQRVQLADNGEIGIAIAQVFKTPVSPGANGQAPS